ncbi:hypothetical protein [Ruthenibacterium lactatiformans]|uniref:hypothetical protein n=1 Tax=Ruthenibacterium lactatiformans TaxID=1550024 RepID=UPI0026DB5BB7|nr:hypothetical protein [Ruthenibacterium lactatiformans]
MQNDPFETQNLYGDPAYSAVVQQLREKLDEQKRLYQDTDDRYPELVQLRLDTLK